MWIIVGTTATLAFAFQALNQFSTWRFEQGINDKIVHQNIRFGTNPNQSGENSTLLIGFEVQNRAKFPLDIYVEDIETQLGGEFPPRKPFANRQFAVPAFGIGWFQDHFIEVSKDKFGTIVEGSLRYRVLYGRAGKLAFVEQRSYNLFVDIDTDRRFRNASWSEIYLPPKV